MRCLAINLNYFKMKEVSTFKKRVISVNDQEKQNLILGFNNEAKSINNYWHQLNALLGTLYKLSDIIAFIENPNILKDVFNKENKSLAIATAKQNSIGVEALKGLDSISLDSKQQGIINELQKFSSYSMFKYFKSEDWLIKEEIVVTEKVQEVFEELTTEYTKAPVANSRFNLLEQFLEHLVQFPNDRANVLQILKGGENGRQFINYGL